MVLARVIFGIVGALQLANGVATIVAPDAWYAAVPGVSATGPVNYHFIVDIGLAFVSSGALMLAALRRGHAALAFAGATWPALHGLFHLWIWIAHGLGADTVQIASNALVMVLSFTGLALAFTMTKEAAA